MGDTTEVKKQNTKHESGIHVFDRSENFLDVKIKNMDDSEQQRHDKWSRCCKNKESKKRRSQTLEEMEKSLLIWINKKELIGDGISESFCGKAR